jgi:hypothetical protein
MKRLSLVWAACLAVGCAGSKIGLPDDCRIAAGQGAVIGRLQVVANGRSVGLSSIFGESTGGVFLLPERDGAGRYVPLYDEGVFLWSLRSGTYRIAGFDYDAGRRSGRVMARFEVEPGVANLVGTLVVDVVGSRFVTKINQEDETALNAFHRRCPNVAVDGRERPMRVEEQR